MKELNMKANHHPEKVIPVFAVIIFFLSNSYNIPVIAQEDYNAHEWSMFMANPIEKIQDLPDSFWTGEVGMFPTEVKFYVNVDQVAEIQQKIAELCGGYPGKIIIGGKEIRVFAVTHG